MPSNVSPEIEQLIKLLSKLSGLGPRSARRATLDLVKKREALMRPLASAMTQAVDRISTCGKCGNVDVNDPCYICCSRSK